MIDIAYLKKHKLLLLEVISGSQAYGLATPQSDRDIKGVYYLPKEFFYSGMYIDQVQNETNDEVYYELGKFVELLGRNNPNLLEMLATPPECILYRHPLMDCLKPEMFLSLKAKETFAGYAYTQIKKAGGLNRKWNNPMPETRKTVLEFCYVLKDKGALPFEQWLAETGVAETHCGLTAVAHAKDVYALYCSSDAAYGGIVSGAMANEVRTVSVPPYAVPATYLYFNQDAYSLHCRQYREYHQWLKLRNEQRYLGNQAHKQGYDAKNMMHTIRLLQVALELLQTGRIAVRRSNRDELLAIKSGKYTYDALMEMAAELMQKIESATITSPLPPEPDKEAIQRILYYMRLELYKD